jgi:protein-disulfide isomerase
MFLKSALYCYTKPVKLDKELQVRLMDKRFWGIVAAVVVVLVGAFIITNHNNPSNSSNSQPTNHVEGQNQDGILLMEYGDYECPYCGQYFPIVKEVESIYSPYIEFQFRNLPLTELHPNAFAGARAAEAAALQNQFWQMHDLLYENQDSWSTASNPVPFFDQYAQQLGLNVSTFEQDFASDQVNNSINADVAAFDKTGAQEATPSFFLDGTQINPTESVASFEQLLNAEIQKKTGKASPIAISSSTGSTSAPQSTQ